MTTPPTPTLKSSPTIEVVAEQLVFTGALEGSMDHALNPSGFIHVKPSKAGFDRRMRTRCATWTRDDTYGRFNLYQSDIVGEISGQQWALSIEFNRDLLHPPAIGRVSGKLSDGDMAIWLVPPTFPKDSTSWYNTYGAAGSVTFDASLKSGTMDVILPQGPNGAKIHVTGIWRCAN